MNTDFDCTRRNSCCSLPPWRRAQMRDAVSSSFMVWRPRAETWPVISGWQVREDTQDCDDTIMLICLELFRNPWVELKAWSAVEPVKLGFSWAVMGAFWSHARLRLWCVLVVPLDSKRWQMILSSRFLRRLLLTTSLSTWENYSFFLKLNLSVI